MGACVDEGAGDEVSDDEVSEAGGTCGSGVGALDLNSSACAPALKWALVTLEGLVVGAVPQSSAWRRKLRGGDLIKFTVDGALELETRDAPGEGGPGEGSPGEGLGLAGDGCTFESGDCAGDTRFVLLNPRFQKKCSPSRALADSW